MTRGRKDKLNYDPGKDKISPSDLVGGGADLQRARNQELVRSFPVAQEEPIEVPPSQVEPIDRVRATGASVTPLSQPTQRPNVSAIEDSAVAQQQRPVDKLAVLRSLYSVYPDVDILALMESELNKQQKTYGA
jgi:hypothetical protein|tara:strand:+ start:3002 stop:3400 length:399 start_codon:yes stop_codon:yes gene_type:complete